MSTARVIRKVLFATAFAVMFPFALVENVFGASTTLTLSPASGTYAQNENFDVNLVINTGVDEATMLDAVLTYDESKLSVVTISPNEAIFPEEATVSASNGRIVVSKYYTSGSYTGTGNVATITFKPLVATGSSVVNFVTGTSGFVTHVLSAASTELLSSTTGATYTFSATGGGANVTTGGTNGSTTPTTGIIDSANAPVIAGTLLLLSGAFMVVLRKKYY